MVFNSAALAPIWSVISLIRASVRANSVSSACASGSVICSMRAVALRSKPIVHDTDVVSATAISTPGNLGAQRRIAQMMAMAAIPMAKVGICVSPTCCSTPQMSWPKCSERPIGTPINLLTCDRPMIMAAALVKPTITGCERKLTTTPSLKGRAPTAPGPPSATA